MSSNDFLKPVDFSIASKILRLANYFIDLAALFVFFVFLGFLAALAGGFELLDNFIDLLDSKIIGNLLSMTIYFSFMFFQEFIFKGRSIGKFITGTMTVYEDGGTNLQVYDLFIRNISRIIPFEPISLLFQNAGWHDTISKTRVVVKKEFERRKNDEGSIDKIGEVVY